MFCPYCGSQRIETGIMMSDGGTNEVGLEHLKGIFVGTEDIYSDLCLDCGTIVRMYVKNPQSRNWFKGRR